MTPRTYGTGSVFQRSRDGRWIAQVPAGWTANGARRYRTRTATSKAEANRKLRDLLTEMHAADAPAAGTRPTVKTWSEQWLTMHVTKVRPNTYTTDAGAVRKWIVPTLGHKRLEQLTPGDVRSLRNTIIGAGKSSTTARQAHWTLMGMLKAARAEGHKVPTNVTEVAAPAKAVSDREAIPIDDALKLLALAADEPDGSRWVAALLEGIRQGERLGLTWDAIDFTAGELDISWQLQPLPYLDPKDRSKGFRVPDGYEARHLVHSYHLTRPKTAAGRRIVPMVPWLASALATWQQVAPSNPWGLVWCAVDRRHGRERPTPIRSADDLKAWKALQERAGVRHPGGRFYTDHEARNTTATLLFEAGTDPKVITQILGHASIVTSRGYQTVSRQQLRDAMERVASALTPRG